MNMNELTTIAQTMSSREIAELTEKNINTYSEIVTISIKRIFYLN